MDLVIKHPDTTLLSGSFILKFILELKQSGNQKATGKLVQGVRFAITPSKELDKAEARTIKIKIKNRRFKSEKV